VLAPVGVTSAGALTAVAHNTQVVDEKVMAAVRRRGWAVVDGALGATAAAALAAEASALGAHAPTRQRLMRQNCTHFVHDGAAQLLPKVRTAAVDCPPVELGASVPCTLCC
jgi:hypothetical protein